MSPQGAWSETKTEPMAIRGHAMGTTYTLKFPSLPAGVTKELIAKTADALFFEIEKAVSGYRADSEVMRFNAARLTDWFPVSPATARLATEALRVAEVSGGAFDPTVDPLVRLWGFGAARRTVHRVPAQSEIDAALARVGWRKLSARIDPPALKKSQPDVAIDLSALTSGYALDELGARLDALGLRDYLLELGGALKAKGRSQHARPWRTGIEEPGMGGDAEMPKPRRLACRVELADKSISTSGSSKQFFEAEGRRFSHLIDARTGWPVTHNLVAVTVVADSCLEADALDTALMAMGPEAAWKLASARNMAVLLISHTERELTKRTTPAFQKLTVSEGD